MTTSKHKKIQASKPDAAFEKVDIAEYLDAKSVYMRDAESAKICACI